MGLFRLGRKGDEDSSTRQQADEAIERARADIRAVESREDEVNWLYDAIVRARGMDNFGPPLTMAFQRKSPDADR